MNDTIFGLPLTNASHRTNGRGRTVTTRWYHRTEGARCVYVSIETIGDDVLSVAVQWHESGVVTRAGVTRSLSEMRRELAAIGHRVFGEETMPPW